MQEEGKESQIAQLHSQVQQLSSRLSKAQEKTRDPEPAAGAEAAPKVRPETFPSWQTAACRLKLLGSCGVVLQPGIQAREHAGG